MPRPFSTFFLAGDPAALSFLPADFRDGEARIRHALEASKRTLTSGLAAILRSQSEALPPSAARRENIEALATPGTVAVVTGQQVGLFLGPLYTVYKAASAIAMARALERESGVRCVPVFWLQTEDHDFAEINHCSAPRPGAAPLRQAVTDAEHASADGERVSVAHRSYGSDVSTALDELESCLGKLPEASDHFALLRAHFRPGASLPAAFAGMIAALFADEGLVVFDPRQEAVARLLTPFYRRVLDDSQGISALLSERGRALEQAGFDEQVRIRPRSPLLFFHRDSSTGPRFRMDPISMPDQPPDTRPPNAGANDANSGRGWRLAGGHSVIDAGDLDAILARDPLRLSTTALLRPIAQDILFPTVAYVGGPGEINYYAQLMPLYSRFDLPAPLITPRARFRCFEAHTQHLLAKAGLAPDDLALPRAELIDRVGCRVGGRVGGRVGDLASSLSPGLPHPDAIAAELLAGFSARMAELDKLLAAHGPDLTRPVQRTRTTVEHAVVRFALRYRRALGEHDRVAVERIDRLQAFLYPEGAPQERVHSLSYFACRVGWPSFKSAIFAALDDKQGGPWTGASRDLDF